jgi:hypothetical protein
MCSGDYKILTCSLITAVLIISITLLSLSLSTIESTEIGLEYKTVTAILSPVILREGLNTHVPGSDIIKWPITYQTISNSLSCNSQNGIRIDMDLSFQFIPMISEIYELTLMYTNFNNYKGILVEVARSSIRHSCSDFQSETFQKNRSMVRDKISEDITGALYKFKSNVIELQLLNLDRPPKYEDAIAMTENSRTDIGLAENERQQKITAANTQYTVNAQNANKTIDLANTEASVIQMNSEYQSNAILEWYISKKNILKSIQKEHNLTVPNLLTYLGNNLLSSNGRIVVSEPSKLNY